MKMKGHFQINFKLSTQKSRRRHNLILQHNYYTF